MLLGVEAEEPVVTITGTAVEGDTPAGIVTEMLVELVKVTGVAATPPTVTVEELVKLVPVIVITCPTVSLADGAIEPIVGVAVEPPDDFLPQETVATDKTNNPATIASVKFLICFICFEFNF
jgi:hypothetical protein